jgi:hypothetical protein
MADRCTYRVARPPVQRHQKHAARCLEFPNWALLGTASSQEALDRIAHLVIDIDDATVISPIRPARRITPRWQTRC